MQYLSEKFRECYIGTTTGVPTAPCDLPTCYTGRCYCDSDMVCWRWDGTTWNLISGSAGTTVPTPTLTGPASGNENTTVQITISNYNSGYTYTVNVPAGSYTRSGSTIDWTLPSVSSDTNYDIQVRANDGTSDSDWGSLTVNVIDVPVVDDQTLVYDTTSMGEFTDLVNAEVNSLDSTAVDTTDVMDHSYSSTATTIYLDNSKVTVEPGETITTNSENCVVSVVNNDGTIANISGVHTIAGGYRHTMILRNNGEVWGTGDNSKGQLGDNSTIERHTFVQSMDTNGVITDAVNITAGKNYTAIIRNSGEVWGTGQNNYGQLGDNTTTDRYTFVQAQDTSGVITDAKKIAGGLLHSTIIRNNGEVWGCGNNSNGQLGDNTTVTKHTFIQSQDSSGVITDAQNIAAGNSYTAIIRNSGEVWGCGYNNSGQLGDNTTTDRHTFVQSSDTNGVITGADNISCSTSPINYNTTVIIRNNGEVWGCGNNNKGQLGDNTTLNRNIFVQSSDTNGFITDAVNIVAGNGYTVIIRNSGEVWGCGLNSSGELGDNTGTERHTFVQSQDVNGFITDAVDIGTPFNTGGGSTVIIRNSGEVWGTGLNANGQLGNNNTSDVSAFVQSLDTNGFITDADIKSYYLKYWVTPVTNLSNTPTTAYLNTHRGISNTVTQDSGDTDFRGFRSGLTKEDVVEIQDNSNLSNNTTSKVYINNKLYKARVGETYTSENGETFEVQVVNNDGTVDSIDGVHTIACGDQHTMIIRNNGEVWGTGDNTYGELGDGTTTQRNTFVQSSDTNGFITNADTISCGNYHTIIIRNNGEVWGCGKNDAAGVLGDNTTVNKSTFVQAMDSSGFITNANSVAGGGQHTMIIRNNGEVWGTGNGGNGERSDGTTTNVVTYVQSIDSNGFITNAEQIFCGNYHTAIIRNSGELWSTGYNQYGQLGDNTVVNKTTFIQSSDTNGFITNANRVSCGSNHSAIIRNNGEVWACGKNTKGQLGDGSTVDKHLYTRDILSITNAINVSCSTAGSSTMIIRNNGEVWGCGSNIEGQLGDGSTVDKSSFIQATLISDASEISAGQSHTAIIRENGEAFATGRNIEGQLGDGTTVDKASFVQSQDVNGYIENGKINQYYPNYWITPKTTLTKIPGKVYPLVDVKFKIPTEDDQELEVASVDFNETVGSTDLIDTGNTSTTSVIYYDHTLVTPVAGEVYSIDSTGSEVFTVSSIADDGVKYWIVPLNNLSIAPSHLYTWTPQFINQSFSDKLIPACREFKTDVHLADSAKLQEFSAMIQKVV